MTEIPLTTRVGGRLIPANSVQHAVSANGIVRSVFVKPGQEVRAGDPLFSVERDDLSGSYVPALVAARIPGTVSSVSVKPNATVRSGDQGVTVIDSSELYLEAYLSDKDALSLRAGTEVIATVAGGLELKGVIHSRSPEPDYSTGLFTLTLRFPGTGGAPLGQFATAELPLGKLRGIFLQQDLLQRMYGRYQVWTVDSANLLQSRRVTIGAIYGNQVLIEDGLRPGELILLKRTGKEKAGDPVEGAVE
ncbi:MAG: hypothetical protein A2Y36_13330 [Treponema sp. GWA1_62_8]|nr:MAG: hypothetical protein A2Y36_13330 [Treponema sp. GWA1_62_8]OHE64584.1 MAG: hypothetical protein A2001_00205 [Treponema sp. GWC1_61_84]